MIIIDLINEIKNIIFIAITYALGFAIIESIIRQIDIHILNLQPIHPYTTFPQFLLTMLWTPFILKHKNIQNKIFRYFLFPLNIYTCEIIGGNILLYFFNYRAWYYIDNLALFNGMITLQYFPVWMLLHFFEELFYVNIIFKILYMPRIKNTLLI
jgi:hypothetical protein